MNLYTNFLQCFTDKYIDSYVNIYIYRRKDTV